MLPIDIRDWYIALEGAPQIALHWLLCITIPDSKVHGTNMGPIWGRQDPGGPHVGPMNFAIWDDYSAVENLAGHFSR